METITELKAKLLKAEQRGRAEVKRYFAQKWKWKETGELYDFSNPGNNEFIFGITGDAAAILRKLNLPNYTKHIDHIIKVLTDRETLIPVLDDEDDNEIIN